ncbi:MAG: NADH-quinone oxidoreductase subunit M, partial [Proteobacteria bacterium]|nr:NADH-quinone oxidoreductase subunit M [Pseudomonadota bacterium]
VLYDRMHTKQISAYGGLVERMPSFALMFMVFTMASIGLPGTSGFVGEFLVLTGLFRDSTWAAFFAATGVVLGAAYMLWLYRRVVFGLLEHKKLKGIKDIDTREAMIFIAIAVVVIVLGIYPTVILHYSQASIAELIQHVTLPEQGL